MSLLPPAFKDPAFAPLGRPIRRLTVADARKHQSRMQRFAALEGFECENHGNADTGCLQEPCMPPAGKEVLRRGEIGQINGRINIVTSEAACEMLNADVAHMRESKQITVSALLRAGQKLDANLAPPSPELTAALANAQAALTCGVPTQPKPKSLREACCDKMFDLAEKDNPLVKSILTLFGAATLAGIEDKYLPDLWDQLNRPF